MQLPYVRVMNCLLVLSVVVAAGVVNAGTAPSPESIVQGMVRKIRSLNTFEETSVQSISQKAQGRTQTVKFSVHFVYKKPNKFVYQYDNPRAGMSDGISDGKTLWIHAPVLGEYAKATAPATMAKLSTGPPFMTTTLDPLAFLRGEDPLKGARDLKLVGSEAVEGKSTHHLSFVKAHSGTVHMWIGTKDSLPYKLQMHVVGANGEATITETHTKMKMNHEVPDSTFTFKPPKGAKQVEQFSAPGKAG